jgi:hypothetical protein
MVEDLVHAHVRDGGESESDGKLKLKTAETKIEMVSLEHL